MDLGTCRELEVLHESERTRVIRVELGAGSRALLKMPTQALPTAAESACLEHEYSMLRRVAGEGVVAALGVQTYRGRPCLVLADGAHQRMPAGQLPLTEVLSAGVQITAALQRVHAAGVVHGDLNPANIVRDSQGQVLLIDLGVAFEPLSAMQAQERGVVGTLQYLAPEQSGRIGRGLDGRVDLYSLGVALFQWLTGQLPFEAEDAVGWLHAHLSHPVPQVRRFLDVPDPVSDVVAKLLAKDPRERYQSARSLHFDLVRCERSLRETGDIAPFELARFDLEAEIRWPGLPLERRELAAQVAASGASLIHVWGPPGAGRSPFLDACEPQFVSLGLLASCRLDEQSRFVPLSGIAAALHELPTAILLQPPARVAQLRDAVSQAVGRNRGALLDIQPRLAAFLGPRPASLAGGSTETGLSRQLAARAFFKVLAGQMAVTLMYYDGQWLDEQSIEILSSLVHAGGHLKVVVSSEESELPPAWQAASGPSELAAGPRVETIAIPPLSISAVQEVLQGAFIRVEALPELARLIHEKSSGLPLFVREFVEKIHAEGALRFDPESDVWHWDPEQVAQLPICGNVAELVLRRLDEVTRNTLAVLQAASVYGDKLQLRKLAQNVELEGLDLPAALAEAQAEKLLLAPQDGYIAFAHRSVREAVFAGIKEDKRARLHYQVAQQMTAAAQAGDLFDETDTFAVARHFWAARGCQLPLQMRLDALEWERKVVAVARNGAGYRVAAEHLQRALAWLTRQEWSKRRSEHFQLLRAQAECVLFGGDAQGAERLCAALLQEAHDDGERVAAHRLGGLIRVNMGRFTDAMTSFLAGLEVLGMSFPSEPEAIAALTADGLNQLQARLSKTSPRALAETSEMTDPRMRSAMDLLVEFIPLAYQTNSPLFVPAEIRMFLSAVEFGVTPSSAKNWANCAILQIQVFHDVAAALRFIEAAYFLVERFSPSPYAAAVCFIDALFISPYRDTPKQILALFEKAQREGEQTGDMFHAAYAAAWAPVSARVVGESIQACLARCHQAKTFCKDAGAELQLGYIDAEVEQLQWLVAREPPTSSTEQRLRAVEQYGPVAIWGFWRNEALRTYLLRDRAGLDAAFERLQEMEGVVVGRADQCDYALLKVLYRALQLESQNASAQQLREVLAEITRLENELAGRAQHNPALYDIMHLLALAERTRCAGADAAEIAECYERVVDHPDSPLTYVKAIACERHAEFWLRRGQRRLARSLLQDAALLYRHWGAEAKVAQLWAEYAAALGGATQLAREPRTGTHTASRTEGGRTEGGRGGGSLDIDAVMKAVTAISAEVVPDRLFAALMRAILEQAGAQACYLVRRNDEELSVWARARVQENVELEVVSAASLDLPQELLQYVCATREHVILGDAQADPRFSRSQGVRERQVRSVLCVPILYSGEVWGVLYVENNVLAGAFSGGNVQLLRVIAGQAAVSMDNVNVYQRLERLVAQRTRELASRNREVVTLLDNLPQGVFTVGEDLVLGSEFSARLPELLGETAVAGRSVVDLLFRNTNLSTEAIDMHVATLRFGFGSPRELAELNWPHLVREFRRQCGEFERDFEADWACIVDEQDHVVQVLATLRDVTELRRLQVQLAEASTEAKQIDEAIATGLPEFLRFCTQAQERLQECVKRLEQAAAPSSAVIEAIFRELHTLKGTARMLGLDSISTRLHVLEEPYVQLREDLGAPITQPTLLEGLHEMLAELEGRRVLIRRKFGKLGDDEAAAATSLLDAARTELRRSQEQASDPREVLRTLAELLDERRAGSLRTLVGRAARSFAMLAEQVGKPVPTLAFSGPDLTVDGALGQVLNDVLVHVFRNALDHGIEAPEERALSGKASAGRIEVQVDTKAGGLSIAVRDDGRGLGLGALRTQLGSELSDEALAESIFKSGVSTAARVTELSGRGVGMDAVRAFVEEHGGRVGLVFLGPEQAGYRPFELRFFWAQAAVAV